jgi:ribosomal protein S18 acetylase RimI-like enzyme
MQIKVINPKNPGQAEEIRRFFFAAYRQEAQLLGLAEADFFPLGRTAAHIQAAEAVFLGCFLDNKLVALAEIETEGPQQINIGSFVVAPEMFRKGIGTALLKEVLARYPGFSLTVSTAKKNLPAIGLYEKHGFVVQQTWYTPDGIEMVTLRHFRNKK